MGHDTSRIKVLHLRSSGAMLGAENVIIEIANNSEQHNVESIIGIPVLETDGMPDFVDHAKDNGTTTKVFAYKKTLDKNLPGDIHNYVRENNIDIIHCHGYQEDFYAWLSKSGVPLIATNHLWKRTDFKLKVYAWLDSKILKKFSHIVAVSAPIHQELIAAGINKNNISTIANGINLSRFSRQPDSETNSVLKYSFGLPLDAITIGMVSSLTEEKGHVFALEALARTLKKMDHFAQPIFLLIVGDGDYREDIKTRVRKLGLEKHVIFAGPRSDVPDILAMLDIYILPSLIEGLPMSLLEAMASGLPVIASDVGDISTVIHDGDNGYLTEAKDVSRLSDRLATLITDEGLRSKFSTNAKENIEKNYSSKSMTAAYCKIYRQALHK